MDEERTLREQVDFKLWALQLEREDVSLWGLIRDALDDMDTIERNRNLSLSRALGVLLHLDRAQGFLGEWGESFCADLGDSDEDEWTPRQRNAAVRLVKTHDDVLRAAGYGFAPEIERMFGQVRRYRKVP